MKIVLPKTEVIIEIPPTNDFLQNEKVVIRLPIEETSLMDMVLNYFKGSEQVYSGN